MKGTVIEGTKALLRHETSMHSCCIFVNKVRLLYCLLSTGLINQINNDTRAEFINLNMFCSFKILVRLYRSIPQTTQSKQNQSITSAFPQSLEAELFMISDHRDKFRNLQSQRQRGGRGAGGDFHDQTSSHVPLYL